MKITLSLDRLIPISVAVLLVFFSGCSKNTYYVSPETSPATYPLVDSATIEPGLNVRYYDEKYEHITDMPKGKQLEKLGRSGQPIFSLNNVYGKRSNIFNSGKSRLIGFWFSGLIHLEKPGDFYFQALSNDGIRCFLNQELIFEDPLKHSTRLSPVGFFRVEQPGWYPLQIIYFQRKGTAALKLYWKQPGQGSFKIVPAAVLGHTG